MWTGPNDAPVSTKEERMSAMRIFATPRRPSRPMMFLARLFGEKQVAKEGSVTVTTYMFRGVLYVAKIEQAVQE